MAAEFTSSVSSVSEFEPLFPRKNRESLGLRSQAILASSYQLNSMTHASARTELRELVRAMNSYYSNRIEGQGTHPRNIERALRSDFSDKPDVARLQRIALAHMQAERELEEKVAGGARPLRSTFVLEAHRALYERLSVDDRTTQDGLVVDPGALRTVDVVVGAHHPPTWKALPRFLARLDEAYDRDVGLDEALIYIGAEHHRLAWIHPFVDGNGRAARLQTHAALWPIGAGLWSPNRGLARRRDEYYARLAEADGPRRGDLDGRGNLTDEGLGRWVSFFLEICEDQVSFMKQMFDLDNMKRRIAALVLFRASQDKGIRIEAALPLYHLFAAGPVTRGEFQQMTGMGERVARSLLSRLLATGLVRSDSAYGPVRFAAPLDALQFLFPDLYPEAATSE